MSILMFKLGFIYCDDCDDDYNNIPVITHGTSKTSNDLLFNCTASRC